MIRKFFENIIKSEIKRAEDEREEYSIENRWFPDDSFAWARYNLAYSLYGLKIEFLKIFIEHKDPEDITGSHFIGPLKNTDQFTSKYVYNPEEISQRVATQEKLRLNSIRLLKEMKGKTFENGMVLDDIIIEDEYTPFLKITFYGHMPDEWANTNWGKS